MATQNPQKRLTRTTSNLSFTGAADFEAFDQSAGILPQDHVSQDHPQFNVRIFAEQVLYQVLFPLSLPLVYLVRGHNAALNMRFVPSREQVYISMFQYILNGAVVVALALYWGALTMMTGPADSDVLRWCVFYEVVLLTVSSVFQRLPVATKWAFLPGDQYEYVMTHRVRLNDLLKDQMLTGWADLTASQSNVLDKEMRLAQRRLGIDADSVLFLIQEDKMAWLEQEVCTLETIGNLGGGKHAAGRGARMSIFSSAAGEEKSHADDEAPVQHTMTQSSGGATKQLSASTLAKMLIYKANLSEAKMGATLAWTLLGACTLGSVLPLFVRIGFGLPPMGDSAVQTALFSLSIFCNFWYPFIFSHYLRVALLDYRRRSDTLRRLGELCMLSNPRQLRKHDRRTQLSLSPRQTTAASLARGSGFDGMTNPMAVAASLQQVQPVAAVVFAEGAGSGTSTDAGGRGGASSSSSSSSRALLPSGRRVGAAVLPLDTAANIGALLITRRLLTTFGLRYFLRLQAYTSQALVLTAGITVCIVALSVVSLPAALQAANATIAAVALFYLLLFAAFIVAMLLYGAAGNAQAAEHVGILIARDWEARQAAVVRRNAGDADAAARCEGVSSLLVGASAMIGVEAQLQPLRIVGVPASYGLVRALAATAVSAATAGANLVRGLLLR